MCYGYFEKSTETRNTSPPLHMYCICLVVERVVYPKSNLMKIGCRQVEPGFFPTFFLMFLFLPLVNIQSFVVHFSIWKIIKYDKNVAKMMKLSKNPTFSPMVPRKLRFLCLLRYYIVFVTFGIYLDWYVHKP